MDGAVFVGKSLLGDAASGVTGADSENNSVSKFCLALSCSSLSASFCKHVACVVSISTKEQVVRTATTSVITVVTNTQLGRDYAVRQKPRNTMYVRILCVHIDINPSIAVFVYLASPVPATIGLLNFCPKMFG